MKTDEDALASGIDPRRVVADSMKELMLAFAEMIESHNADRQYEMARRAWLVLDLRGGIITRARVDEARSEMIEMRNGLLVANQFEWSTLCTHAIWWLSAILEG